MGMIVGIFSVIPIFLFIFLLVDWSESCPDAPHMKFDQWHDIYLVRPGRWTLYTVGPAVSVGWTTETYVRFSFIDYYRYQWWLRGEKKREKERDNNKELQRILEQAQGDIEELKKKADSEMERVAREVKTISKRISEMN